jgi:hypothetical protein
LEDGTGDSVLASAGIPTEGVPFVTGLGMGACLIVGDAILGGRVNGLVDPAERAGWECELGLREGAKREVAGGA